MRALLTEGCEKVEQRNLISILLDLAIKYPANSHRRGSNA